MRISPPLEGRGRGGVFDPKVILAFFSNMTFSALWVWTLSLGVEVTDPTPDPFAVRHKTLPYRGGDVALRVSIPECGHGLLV